ncbi:MAG: CoA transferase [Gammaproteobacteria bacterium]|nr:CoA transferase [Gammaproteobacteria bacterium]
MPFSPASKALSDVKVLDLTRVRSGPTCVRQLADWGADVIKVELPESMEADGALGAKRHTCDFQNLQRNKRSLTLNLKAADGLAVFKRLVAKSDVVVENYRPDVKHRLGIDYASLKAINPRIILGSISGFGQDGPYAKRPGFDQIAQGMGGLMSITGLPGQGPVRVGIPIADLTGGLFCALGILVALHERERSGEGQWVHTSLLQAQLFMLDFQGARWTMDGEVPAQAGNNHPTSIPTGVFKTSDGHINIAVAGQTTWTRFAECFEGIDWLDNPHYATAALRSQNRDMLNAQIEAQTAQLSSDALIARLIEAEVPCGEIHTIDNAFENEQVKHLGLVQRVDSPALGTLNLVGQPVALDRTPSTMAVAPPERGQHTDEVLAGLGYSADEIRVMRDRQIV